MRLVQVAKVLGMTGQDLRKELLSVDFGVKPTDREIADSLAQGIIRYFARVKGLEIDMDALFGASALEMPVAKAVEEPAAAEAPVAESGDKEHTGGVGKKEVNVLRKLTLEDVPQAAIAAQEKSLSTSKKKERRKPAGTPKAENEELTRHQEQIKKKEGVVILPDQITVKEFDRAG